MVIGGYWWLWVDMGGYGLLWVVMGVLLVSFSLIGNLFFLVKFKTMDLVLSLFRIIFSLDVQSIILSEHF